MTGPFATRLFRLTFVLAGAYNLAFGLWAGFRPLHFFRLFDIDLPRYPAIWSCLGMVVGIYGLLYWRVAWRPQGGRSIITIGLLGKLLGPVGMVLTVGDDWPRRLFMLNVFNDVIWWLPFTLFLVRGTWLAGRLAAMTPWLCAALHAAALGAMGLVLRGGMLIETETVRRATHVVDHAVGWSIAWTVWMASSIALVAFYAWWGSRLTASSAATAGVLLASGGMICDLSGESLAVTYLVEQARGVVAGTWSQAMFQSLERTATLLTAGLANGCYTLGGFLLMRSTPNLPRAVRVSMWATWIAGGGMTLAALSNRAVGMAAAILVLFPLFIAWTVWMGATWNRSRRATSRPWTS